MKIYLLLTAASVLFLSAYSQNDSTRLDVGGVVLKRAFTQNITIKGEDLEKMPFTDLSAALGAWLQGTYTNSSNVKYVVDGNIISDVNTFSIHDIAEVVLVQNAAALTGTGSNQIVLITTRKGKGAYGLTGGAQTFLVSSPHATTNLYHQYYLGAYRNMEKISFGFSANYLRDAAPNMTSPGVHVSNAYHLDRWRLNGYFTWRPDQKNTIEVHAGFTPQSSGYGFEYSASYAGGSLNVQYKGHSPSHLFLPWARWHGEWLPGLKNDLQVGLASELDKGQYWQLSDNGPGMDKTRSQTSVTAHADHLYIRDRISYQIKAGSWEVEPSFNASYEHLSNNYYQHNFSQTISGNGGLPGNTSESGTNIGPLRGSLYILTPGVDISYLQRLYIQGGFAANVSHSSQQGVKRIYPFGSVALELLRPANNPMSLKIFGSYTQRAEFSLNDYAVNDLAVQPGIIYINSTPVVYQPGGPFGGTINFPTVPANHVKTYWAWQTGARFASRNERWQVSYHFQRSNFSTLGTQEVPGGFVWIYSEWKSVQHFLYAGGRVVEKGAFGWQLGVTATIIRNKTDMYPDEYSSLPPVGDYARGNGRPSWTGGWTNRLHYRDLSLGLDMQYHFNREMNVFGPTGAYYFSRANTFLLQNIYFGYRLHLPGKMGLEIYADSRGLVRSDKSNVLDQRRYYGLGGKITI